jgi:hypothetical protein
MRYAMLIALGLIAAMRLAAADLTAGAIPGEQLVPFAPAKAAGVARSNLLDQAFATAAAYKLDAGGYANLDIQNTFHRGSGDTSIVDRYLASKTLCPKKEKLGGFTACIRAERDRATIYWYLPDRLAVTLSAPTEKLVRAMAADLPLAALAKLSAAR